MKLKKIYCYILLLVLLINAPISVYAKATSTTPTVTIAAGTGAAVGGAYQGYTSKTAAAATALTLAVLSATGAAVKLTEASVQAGKTVYQVINDKFAQWVGGTSAEELSPSEAEELQSRFKVITGGGGNSEDPDNDQNNGTNIGEDGKLWFSPGSLAMLKQFCDYLEASDSINTYEEAQPGSLTTSAYGQTCYTDVLTVVTVKGTTTYTMSKKCACYVNNYPGSWITFVCNGPFTVYKDGKAVNLYTETRSGLYGKITPQAQYNAGYYTVRSTIPHAATTPGNYNDTYSLLGTIIGGGGWHPVEGSDGSIETDGIYKGENYNSDILQNPNNQILVIDPGILSGFNVDSDRQIAIPDYIDLIIQQAEQKAKNDAQQDPSPAPQELPVPLIDPIAGTKSPANWIDPAPEDAIQDPVESEKRDPEPDDPKDPVIDEDTPTDPEDAIELMKVDLTRIFPFCIPWDLYRLLTKFNAEPVTPSITIDWGDILGTFGIDYVTTLDLHDYDNVASILRTMETVAFVVGLAVATRSIFLRS